jgi:hypothetical protein
MKNDWFELTRMTRGEAIVIERVRVKKTDIVIEGKFEPAPLSQLSMEEQIFITAFIRSHGSIKEMEALFGISYPTVKSRLNSIAGKLEFVEINPPAPHNEVLALLDKGDISVAEALKKLRGDQ